MVAEVALALEIAEDRQHTSVVAAGRLEGDLVLLELAAYLEGTDPVPAVLELRGEWTVLAVVVDPHSHAATCIRPLEAAGVEVTTPASSDWWSRTASSWTRWPLAGSAIGARRS